MFNRDFYPTPPEVVRLMVNGLDLQGKVVFEPEAGKGNIIDVVKEMGAKTIACEIHSELAMITDQKADKFLKHDFFKVGSEEISHVDYIIMNPPFSSAEKHILYAWEIAPEGCEIIALCNAETLSNQHLYRNRVRLQEIVNTNGTKETINNSFSAAERPTDVSISLIHLYKPKTGKEDEFEGYFDLHEEGQKDQGPGVMKHDEILALVNRYVGSMKLWEEVESTNAKINSLAGAFGCNIVFGAYKSHESNYTAITREEYKKELQKAAWVSVFAKFNMKKYVTHSVMEQINKFVEQQTKVPFTVKNIYKMVEMIVGTQRGRMKTVIVELFDRLTKHYHENRYQLEGWKTNSEYRVNRKFILSWGGIEKTYGGKMGYRWASDGHIMDDLTKALCFVSGKTYDEENDFHTFMNNKIDIDEEGTGFGKDDYQYREFGTWYNWEFFRLKGFKKGTLHVEFRDEKIWNMFNQIACEEKGFMLASKFTSDFRQKSTDVGFAA